MIGRAILTAALLAGWSCSCDSNVVCTATLDCDSGQLCLEGICLTACNNDCDCPDRHSCGPIGACVAGTRLCDGDAPPRCGGADLANDPSNCGACGLQCTYPNAFGQCSERQCSLSRCKPGFFDIDQRSTNGCEYNCTIDFESPEETCDGRDNNCDGQVDEGLELLWYRDQDRDGFGTDDVVVTACMRPDGFVSAGGDCDDEDPQRYPGRIEICDGRDNDCDEAIDEDALRPYYIDADGDGYGNPERATIRCAPSEGEVAEGTDCDDTNAQRHPGKLEVCDDLDNNCASGMNDEPYQDFFRDEDGDGFGQTASLVKACRRPDGYALDGGDCDDVNRETNPDATETCDGIDNNCNDQVDEGLPQQQLYEDNDRDGFGAENGQSVQACVGTPQLAIDQTDCDDTDATRFPGAPEWCDGIDQDCDRIEDNNISVRSELPETMGTVAGTVARICADDSEVRWSDQVQEGQAPTIMRRSFDANQAEAFIGAGDQVPMQLPNYGQSSALLGASGNRCHLRVGAGDWNAIGPTNCRPLAACPLPNGGGEAFWVVVLVVSNAGEDTAKLYRIDHLGQAELLNDLVTGSAITAADCTNGRFVAIAATRDNRDHLYAGPNTPNLLRDYTNALHTLDLMPRAQGGALLAITRADGTIEIEALTAQGGSEARRVAVGAPKEAGAARLFPAPSGAVLVYPVLAPAFEHGVWATPVNESGVANGAQQRITNEAILQTSSASLANGTSGMGHLYYLGSDGLRRLFLGCAHP